MSAVLSTVPLMLQLYIYLTLLARFMTKIEQMPIMARNTGDISRQVIGLPPSDSTRLIYGVPRKAPTFSAERVILDASKERCGGT